MKLVFACSDEAPACLAQAGQEPGRVQADLRQRQEDGRRLHGHPQAAGRQRAAVDGLSDRDRARKKPRQRAARAVRAAGARIWLAKLSGGGTPARIMVRANVSGAAVMPRRRPRSASPAHRPLSSSPTSRRASTRSPSRRAATRRRKQEFTLAAGQSLPLTLTLLRGRRSPRAKKAPRPRRREPDAAAAGAHAADEAPGSDESHPAGPAPGSGWPWSSARSRSAWRRSTAWTCGSVNTRPEPVTATCSTGATKPREPADGSQKCPSAADRQGQPRPRRGSGSSCGVGRACRRRRRLPPLQGLPRQGGQVRRQERATTTGCAFSRPPTPPRGASPPSSIFRLIR